MLNVRRGTALYTGALIGPGLLLVPSLAVRAAGPASIIAWLGLIAISAPLAITFAALGVRHPIPGGVSAYVHEAFGAAAAGVTGLWFVTAVVCGGPAVALIGGYYVADLTGSGTTVALATGLAMYAVVLAANLVGVQASSRFQLALSAVLVVVIAAAVIATVPSRATQHWTPFAPHGWWAVGTAANILIWLFIGWEAMAQLAGEFAHPARDLPRAVLSAFAIIAVLYTGLAVATIVAPGEGHSQVPLADLMSVGFGPAGRDITVVLAVTLTVGTMNVYVGSAAKLTASLATRAMLPRWLAATTERSIPRRPLILLAVTGLILGSALAAGVVSAADLVRATSACFIAVYVLALASGVRILAGPLRVAAVLACALVCVVAVFSSVFLLVPAATAVVSIAVRRRRRATVHTDPDPRLPDSSTHRRNSYERL